MTKQCKFIQQKNIKTDPKDMSQMHKHTNTQKSTLTTNIWDPSREILTQAYLTKNLARTPTSPPPPHTHTHTMSRGE